MNNVDEISNLAIIAEYESLDYLDLDNYSKLCARYRAAVDDKDKKLADALYAIMRKAQKQRSNYGRSTTRQIKTHEKRNDKRDTHATTVKLRIIKDLVDNRDRTFSTSNLIAYLYKINALGNKKTVTDKTISDYFGCTIIEAYNALEYATKMGVINKYNGKGYSLKRTKKINESGLKKYLNTNNGKIFEALKDEIEKSGPVLSIGSPAKKKKKKKKKSIKMMSENDLAGKYDRSGDMPFLASEYSSSDIDSMRETGHGRKKSNEYTKSMAIENSRSRYGLKDEKPILEYDLD